MTTGAVAPEVLTIILEPTSATPYNAAAATPILGTVIGRLTRCLTTRSTTGSGDASRAMRA
eukprot:CAMPEP_0178679396 /NCGR_PEP_ID=MMETSP0699-20121125/162_1 /TAXON_ID=265572 /ORGANISM="Extubocellulus spinifer, Strain CCMP396" /LENGTH=60 /DNA_ID=CAMNT_0020323749 /DNA_START=421 /DNA_END=603 /DNA_ORIENTATION=-